MSSKIKIIAKNCDPYAKGWQINAIVDGLESEMTYYGYTKKAAISAARVRIAVEGRLPYDPYRG